MLKTNNILQISHKDCTGCTACQSICPTQAISMKPDFEGFLYPEINQDACVDCGLCLSTCNSSYFYKDYPQKIYACWCKNEDLRYKSSSGGVFSLLAENILNLGGAVVGAGFNEDYTELKHLLITDIKDLDNLRRSKFIQSTKYNIFKQVKTFLNTGKKILFAGTPCEIGGLKQYLKNNQNLLNLYTCDFICGCVSSPFVYKKFTDSLVRQYNSSITSVNFKDKRGGWRAKAIAVKFKNGQEYYNSILDDDYCVSFHSRFNIRQSCFNCKYRGFDRVADITLGDFWAIEKYYPEYDDNKGTSFVMSNSLKGDQVLNSLNNFELHKVNINVKEYATKYNLRIHMDPEFPNPEQRHAFFEDIYKFPFGVACEKHLSEIKRIRKERKLKQQ